MELNQAVTIVKTLADGKHPTTSEELPDTSLYHDRVVIRALYTLLEEVGRKTSRGKRSVGEKQEENMVRGLPRNSGLSWTDEGRTLVAEDYRAGESVDNLAGRLERSEGAIIAELQKQGIISLDDAQKFRLSGPLKK